MQSEPYNCSGCIVSVGVLGRNRVQACRSQLSSTPMLTAQENYSL